MSRFMTSMDAWIKAMVSVGEVEVERSCFTGATWPCLIREMIVLMSDMVGLRSNQVIRYTVDGFSMKNVDCDLKKKKRAI